MTPTILPPGILFDKPYTNGLLAKALEVEYAKVIPSSYMTDVLRRAYNPAIGQKAVEMLLLYNKVYVTEWFDNITHDQLIDMGLVEIIENSWPHQAEVEPEYARGIQALLIADMRRNGIKCTPVQFNRLLPRANEIYLYSYAGIPRHIRQKQPYLPGSSEEDYIIAREIIHSHWRMRNLLEISTQQGIPVFTNIKKVNQVTAGFTKGLHDTTAEVEVALAIYMHESLSIPSVNTLEDVLRLSGDKRLNEFRKKIFEWCERLRMGNVSSEEAIRKEIGEANAAVEDMGRYKKIGMWMTFLSVPISVLEMLSGLPILLLTLTTLGVGIEINNLLRERKYRWLLFGR